MGEPRSHGHLWKKHEIVVEPGALGSEEKVGKAKAA
jgi:hypothetical protein